MITTEQHNEEELRKTVELLFRTVLIELELNENEIQTNVFPPTKVVGCVVSEKCLDIKKLGRKFPRISLAFALGDEKILSMAGTYRPNYPLYIFDISYKEEDLSTMEFAQAIAERIRLFRKLMEMDK